MNQFPHTTNLKFALLSLPPTGEKGFEGLMGTALSKISGVPFRLASSGSQFGIDGKATYEGEAVCFESKLYEDTVPREKVLSKIAELSINPTETDIWILGATSQIGTQLADAARALGAKDGIAVLILDWSETGLPPLAVALAMGGTRVREFLKRNIADDETLREALVALQAISDFRDFSSHANRIRMQCDAPAVVWTLARRANADWLSEAFSNRKLARLRFGQPLSPGDTVASVRQRETLAEKLRPYLTTIADEKVVFVLGGEGNGKSWIVAQSWLALADKPLMVFMSPDDFTEASVQNNVVDLLISKLIKQTGDWDNEPTRQRWRRRLQQWRDRPARDSLRLIAFIDGINQRPKYDWARIIESIGEELNQLGGRLVVTARTPYFRDVVKRRLSVLFAEIDVPEWTENELHEILACHGIRALDLDPAVVTSLRNPRLLGIAFELLHKADVTNIEELSISRLLFEHIRMSERDAHMPQPAQEFGRRLQKHAQEIISRVKANQREDLNIFENDVGAVADGRFFQAVDGDPARYSLKDEGLTLALGFAVIDRLRTAKRNDRNLDAEIETILEPIATLDDTADVMLAALSITVANDPDETDIASSLVRGFATLQNPDQSKFPAFVGIARNRPQSFMDAAHVLSLAGNHQPNFDWIQEALIAAGRQKSAWQEIAKAVHRWLSVYSLSLERGTFYHPQRDPLEKVQEERVKNRKAIEEKLRSLSVNERSILENMPKEEGDLSRLSRLALLLLAGKSLAPFAGSLLNWSFSCALNSDHTEPDKEFIHLVSLNRVDWSQTRAALLEKSTPLRTLDVSWTGRWALVTILRATGHSEDGKEADLLVKDITKDWPSFDGRRLIEQYCATDPCDPLSEQPENVMRTAERYAAIDVSKLSSGGWQSSEDLFLDMARPGVTRFKPEVAVAKHKEFATDVLNRTGSLLRQGLSQLRRHNALFTIREAREFVKKRYEVRIAGTVDGLSPKDVWIVSQYLLLLAFPFLNAHEQAESILSNEADETVLLDLMKVAKPLDEMEFEDLLGAACAQNDERKQYLLLALAKSAPVPLSADIRTHIAALLLSKSERVRSLALGVIAQSGDKELLSQIVKSDWKATDIGMGSSFESWFGSKALLEAAVRGLIADGDVLNRISPCLYGQAAVVLGADAIPDIARRMDMSINRAVGLNGDLIAPDMELQIKPPGLCEPNMFSVSERLLEIKNLEEAMKGLSEIEETFEHRQKLNRDAFLEFKAKLTHEKASIILDNISLGEFASLVASAGEFGDRWYDLFMSVCQDKLPAIHNVILLLAYAFGGKAPDKARELLRRIKDNDPLVTFTFGKAGVHLDQMAIWAGVSNPILNELRFARLDEAATDHALFIEVLAALLNGQNELLTEYVKAKLRSAEPAEISRAIMIAGFSDQAESNDEILKRYEGTAGLTGSAQKAAKYAYERNAWARHWFDKMCQTDDNTDFWRYAILFSKIVDGRFEVWHSDYAQKGNAIKAFGPSVQSGLKNRFARWESNRNKKLFGLDAPAPIFLEKKGKDSLCS